MSTDTDKIASELMAGLTAIAEGYAVRGEHDRYVIVENPKAGAGGVELYGEDPNIVIDIVHAGDLLVERKADKERIDELVEALRVERHLRVEDGRIRSADHASDKALMQEMVGALRQIELTAHLGIAQGIAAQTLIKARQHYHYEAQRGGVK